MSRTRSVLIMAALLSLSLMSFGPIGVKASVSIETLYSGLNFPVAFTFAHDGRIFFNEKNTGNIRVIASDGTIIQQPFATVGPLPPNVDSSEQGLLGIALDPNFISNHYVYVYWTKWNNASPQKFYVITKFTDIGNIGQNQIDIFNAPAPSPVHTNHNGGYIKFGPDGKLYVEIGEGAHANLAQELNTYSGKILRMNPDGSVPSDNPTTGDSQHRLIWAYGYRNGVGMDFSSTGKLIATMAGPDCCDRVFFVSNSTNFGWPNCGTASQPTCSAYTPSIFQTGPTVTPTGITWYSSNPKILYFGEHNTGNLMQLIITPSGTGEVSTFLSAGSGILAVESGPGGIYFSTDAGTIYRFKPPPLNLSLTPNSPANGTILDNTLPDLQIRATINNANVPGVNLTLYVEGTQVCRGQSDAAGLFGCNFQVDHQGAYHWNTTALSDPPTMGLKAHFTVGLVAQVNLFRGWNLISVPVVPANPIIGKVFAAQITNGTLGVIWSYQKGTWKFSNGGSAGSLTAIQDGYGYWVYVTRPSTMYVTGYVVQPASLPPSYLLSKGWNLAGFKPQPAIHDETVSQYLMSIAGSYDQNNVWIYQNSNGIWVRASSSTQIQAGEGLWILMTAPATLKP